MPGSFSWSLSIILVGFCSLTQAGSQIRDMTCADYLGLSTNTDDFDGLTIEAGYQSKAYQAGHKLGIAVRQYTMANWVHGYLIGHAAATSEGISKTEDINALKARMRVYCNTHETRTMREVAESFR